MNAPIPAGPRIVSLLPSATEMAWALGLGDHLVGVTHECDYPPEARSRPAVVRNVLPIETMTQAEIDAAVAERLRAGLGLYELDAPLIEALAPDLILTQSLCDVCAPSQGELAQLLRTLSKQPEIVWMTPRNLAGIEDNIRALGDATGRRAAADALIEAGRARLAAVEDVSRRAAVRPRVFCMEWLDPVYCSGHWVPEMVRIAGGFDAIGREGADSVRVPWEKVRDWAPDVLVFMPCGYALEEASAQAAGLAALPGFHDLPAVRAQRVFAVDASAYFARPGRRVVDGTELLAHLLHPAEFGWRGAPDACRRIDFPLPREVRRLGVGA